MAEAVYFDKYDSSGAYHWDECNRRLTNWKRYNPALDARYELTVRSVAALGRRGDLLDVGCGDGLLMARLSPFANRVVGVDSERSAIRLAKDKLQPYSNCEAIHISSYDLPFADQSFDVVLSADVIEHLQDPAHHLQEVCRLLRDDGSFILTTPKWRPDRKWDLRHEKEYRPEELQTLLTKFFGEVELKYFWPARWSRIYSTRLGWRLLKLLALLFFNPFLGTSTSGPEQFGQLLATCRKPVRVLTR
jgi:2-polyprenyl-3-methyl-5-hydroxy-6-metoxy-1,4-benzoquinol methylase